MPTSVPAGCFDKWKITNSLSFCQLVPFGFCTLVEEHHRVVLVN